MHDWMSAQIFCTRLCAIVISWFHDARQVANTNTCVGIKSCCAVAISWCMIGWQHKFQHIAMSWCTTECKHKHMCLNKKTGCAIAISWCTAGCLMSAQINRMDLNTLQLHDARLDVCTNICVGIKSCCAIAFSWCMTGCLHKLVAWMSVQIYRMDLNTLQLHDARQDVNTTYRAWGLL